MTDVDAAAYQDALVCFDGQSTLSDIGTVAKQHGWDWTSLASDVWGELWDPDFKPWLAEPKMLRE